MKIWMSLYLMIWLAFFEFIFAFTDNFGLMFSIEIHSILAVVMIALAFSNLSKVGRTDAPDRIKRILKAIAGFAVAQAVLGFLLYLNTRVITIPFEGAIDFLHLAIALVMIAQASSAATAYDMWEEKEFMPTATE